MPDNASLREQRVAATDYAAPPAGFYDSGYRICPRLNGLPWLAASAPAQGCGLENACLINLSYVLGIGFVAL